MQKGDTLTLTDGTEVTYAGRRTGNTTEIVYADGTTQYVKNVLIADSDSQQESTQSEVTPSGAPTEAATMQALMDMVQDQQRQIDQLSKDSVKKEITKKEDSENWGKVRCRVRVYQGLPIMSWGKLLHNKVIRSTGDRDGVEKIIGVYRTTDGVDHEMHYEDFLKISEVLIVERIEEVKEKNKVLGWEVKPFIHSENTILQVMPELAHHEPFFIPIECLAQG